MKKYFFYLVSGFCICAIILIVVPDNKAFRYGSTLGDASKTKWIYNVLHSSDKIDVAFIGASYVWQSIIPKDIESLIGDKVVNFGLPYVGRDLDYLIAKETIETKHPKIIVFQLRQSEGRTAHGLFCEIADKHEMLLQPWLPQLAPLMNANCFFRRQLSIVLHTQNKKIPNETADRYTQTKGFKSVTVSLTRNELAGAREFPHPWLPGIFNDFEYYYPRFYLRKISELASSNNIQLYFIYLPDYEDHRTPEDFSIVSKMGKVITLPLEVIDDPMLRSDNQHFNELGAKMISVIVANAIK